MSDRDLDAEPRTREGPIELGSAFHRRLRATLEDADVRVLLLVLVHPTGDRCWRRGPSLPRRDVRLIADPAAGLSPEISSEIRGAGFAALASVPAVPVIRCPDQN